MAINCTCDHSSLNTLVGQKVWKSWIQDSQEDKEDQHWPIFIFQYAHPAVALCVTRTFQNQNRTLNTTCIPRTNQQTFVGSVNKSRVGWNKGDRRTSVKWGLKCIWSYFWAGTRSSIDWPFSSRFSISISNLTPSTTICTSSTSEKPSRSALDMSKTPPTAAVSTPPYEQKDRSHHCNHNICQILQIHHKRLFYLFHVSAVSVSSEHLRTCCSCWDWAVWHVLLHVGLYRGWMGMWGRNPGAHSTWTGVLCF